MSRCILYSTKEVALSFARKFRQLTLEQADKLQKILDEM